MKLLKDDPNLHAHEANTEANMKAWAAEELLALTYATGLVVGCIPGSGTFRYTPPTPDAIPRFLRRPTKRRQRLHRECIGSHSSFNI